MRLSFCMRPSLLLLSRYDTANDYITFIAIWCLCQQSSSRIQNEPGYRKRQFLSITTRHQPKGQRKMLELKEVKKKTKKNKTRTNEQQTEEPTDAKRTEKKIQEQTDAKRTEKK